MFAVVLTPPDTLHGRNCRQCVSSGHGKHAVSMHRPSLAKVNTIKDSLDATFQISSMSYVSMTHILSFPSWRDPTSACR